ncbi:MAG: hypothetical protein KGJ93_02295 [Patescibacteria group bacterium]|nr:hypothetical protein [Patescibacteria group bacterium]
MLATAPIGGAANLVHNFSWTTPSWDLFILLAWVGLAIVYTFAAGRGRVINILLSVYVAKLIVLEMPFLIIATNKLNLTSIQSLQQLAAFTVVFLVLFLFLGRFALKSSADSRHLSAMVFSLVFAFLQIGLLINIILTYLPQGTQQSFSQLIQILFITPPASFVWLVLPIVYLILLGKFVGDTNEL